MLSSPPQEKCASHLSEYSLKIRRAFEGRAWSASGIHGVEHSIKVDRRQSEVYGKESEKTAKARKNQSR